MNIQYSKPNIVMDDEDIRAIRDILNGGWVSIGKYVLQLEDFVKKETGVKHVFACSNATTGLIIAIKAAGIRNKRVAVQPFTWPSTVYALECNGNEPVWCDIDNSKWLMDYNKLDKLSVDAVLGVDVFGNKFELPERKNDLIIDAAHGWGIPGLGKRAKIEVVSLSFTKIVTGCEGGLILTNDDYCANICKELRRLSSRLEEVNAYIALKILTKDYLSFIEHRRELVRAYKRLILAPIEFQDLSPVGEDNWNHSVFSVRFKEMAVRDSVLKGLTKEGVEVKTYYEPIVSAPVSNKVYSETISLPIHKDMTIGTVEHVSGIINKYSNSSDTSPGRSYMETIGYLGKFV